MVTPSRSKPSILRLLASRLRPGLARLWNFSNRVRRAVVNVMFFSLLLAVAVVALRPSGPKFSDKNALLVAPKGVLVEQLTGGNFSPADLLGGGPAPETLLRDVLDTIERAAKDDRINVMVLDLSELSGAGLSKLQEVAGALKAFREQGKTIIATADSYSQAAYYLAAHADEIYLHDMGTVEINGLGRYQMYFKDLLDQLEVTWHIFRVGKYKSAVEPFIANEMSAEAREADLAWMGDLWQAWLDDVASARGLSVAELRDYAENLDVHVAAADGSTAKAALTAKLVHHIGGRDLLRDRVIELVGEDEKQHDFHHVDAPEYLAFARKENPENRQGDKVAVIVARGSIVDGKAEPGAIGGDSTAELVRKARLDKDVKALVLRVDSGGGSAFASEVIRREFELARAAGKPVVVSMGSVAASGGYWISTAADEIWASPTTITGSIGIFGMFPTFEKPLAELGVHVDGVATTKFANISPERGLDPAVGRMIQSSIEHGYKEFLRRVATARNMTIEQVDAVAQGRVWSGLDAKEAGLVDELGGLKEAIVSAAKRADLGDTYRIEYVERDLEFKDRLMKEILGGDSDARALLPSLSGTAYGAAMTAISDQARSFANFNDPHGIYAYAMIDVD